MGWCAMRPMETRVCEDFERELADFYGANRFQVEPKGASAFGLEKDPDHFLQPLKVRTRGMYTRRESMLNAGWDAKLSILCQRKGRLDVDFGTGGTAVLEAGDMLLLDHYANCDFNSQRDNEVWLVPIDFDAIGGQDQALRVCRQRIGHESTVATMVNAAMTSALSAATPTPKVEQALVRDVLHLLLGRLVADSAAQGQPIAGSALIERARLLVLRELANPALTPDAMAETLGVSRRGLYREFASHGMTPASWIWNLRIEQAHVRITDPSASGRTLTAIAFDVGFNDMAHFSRAYRARYGRRPRDARHHDQARAIA
jgi:AraC family transcriptional regulator, positive regulator of tynA and feaB